MDAEDKKNMPDKDARSQGLAEPTKRKRIAESRRILRQVAKDADFCDGCLGPISKDQYGKLCRTCERILATRRQS